MIPQHGRLEISRSRFLHNLQLLRHRLGRRTKLCATIKADAYGHGVALIAPLLASAGIEWACVYSLDEALDLSRAAGLALLVLAPLVLLEKSTLPPDILLALRGQIRLTLADLDSAVRLADALASAGLAEPLNIHIQIDTGLTRGGIHPHDLDRFLAFVEKSPQLHLEGFFAHFSHGDVPDHPALHAQLAAFQKIAAPLKARHPHLLLHQQNSGALFHIDPAPFDMARVGIALYGLQPSTAHPIPGLLPIARITAPILAIHTRQTGTGVGYGHIFSTRRNSRLALVPIGYADGYPRHISNRSIAQLHGHDVPVVGRVSMDQIVLNITDVPQAQVGDETIAVSWNPAKENSLDKIADAIGTIGYELATHFGSRLERMIVD